jgi:hypothetical protein
MCFGGGGGRPQSAQHNKSALISAARNGHADCVRLLLDAGADKEVTEHVRVSVSVSARVCDCVYWLGVLGWVMVCMGHMHIFDHKAHFILYFIFSNDRILYFCRLNLVSVSTVIRMLTSLSVLHAAACHAAATSEFGRRRIGTMRRTDARR